MAGKRSAPRLVELGAPASITTFTCLPVARGATREQRDALEDLKPAPSGPEDRRAHVAKLASVLEDRRDVPDVDPCSASFATARAMQRNA